MGLKKLMLKKRIEGVRYFSVADKTKKRFFDAHSGTT
jgi:hypothetical protein